MSINLTYTHTYNCTLSNVLRLNKSGRRDHKPQTLCVCVLCSHDAVCDAPAGYKRTGKTRTQPQRKHDYIVGFRNGAAKTSTDNSIVYK